MSNDINKIFIEKVVSLLINDFYQKKETKVHLNRFGASSPVRAATALRRSWQNNPKDNIHLRLTKTLQSEISQYSQKVEKLRNENEYLRNLLHALQQFNNTHNPPSFLIRHYQNSISSFFQSINDKSDRISKLETEIKSRRLSYDDNIASTIKKTQLLSEHNYLVDLALSHNHNQVVSRLKLKLSHDLRELMKLKTYANAFLDGMDIDFEFDDQQIKSKKEKIVNLRAAIEFEKSRINFLQLPGADLNEAATLIQKCWRGHHFRQNQSHLSIEKPSEIEAEEIKIEFEDSTEEEEEEEDIIYDDTHIMEQLEIEYNDNCCDDDYDDENGVFNVTCVSHPNRGSDDDSFNEDYKLAPADATNPNFS